MPHAVARLRAHRLARSSKPFMARGGFKRERCQACRLVPSHCMCALRPELAVRAGVCLLMADIEPLKPTNTGWLVADVVPDTFAFGWTRTQPDPGLLALLRDPQWQPLVVFPGQYAAPERVVEAVPPAAAANGEDGRRPLFVLLDATWTEARKMFRRSPYLDAFPVLSLSPTKSSQYRLRQTCHEHHLCTSEVAALCLELADEPLAACVLDAYLDVFTHHYLQAKNQQPVDPDGSARQRLRALSSAPTTDPGAGDARPEGAF